MHLHNFQWHALPDARHAFLAVLGLLQYWYFWKCEVLVLVLILFLKISGIGIGIDILFEYGQYWYWYWYPFWKLSVLVFVLILTLKICRIDIDIDIVVLSYGMKYQYLLKRAGIAHLWYWVWVRILGFIILQVFLKLEVQKDKNIKVLVLGGIGVF